MCDNTVRKISYNEYIQKREETFEKAHSLLEDIRENSAEVYYVETLFKDDIPKHTKEIPFVSGCFKKMADVKNFIKQNTPEKGYEELLFFRISRYESFEKMGAYKNCGFILTLDYTAESILDIWINAGYWETHWMEVTHNIKSFLDEWKRFCDCFNYGRPLIVDCQFQKGDILQCAHPWHTRGEYYVYVGEITQKDYNDGEWVCIDGEGLLDLHREITPIDIHTNLIRNDNTFDGALLRKITRDECPDVRTVAISELVAGGSELCNMVIEYDDMSWDDNLKGELAGKIETMIERKLNPENFISWSADSEESSEEFINGFRNYIENMKNSKITVDDLKERVDLFLKKARSIVFNDCDEREIYSVENIFCSGTCEPSDMAMQRGIYKNYSDVNAAILNYPFDFIESVYEDDKTIKDFMYFTVKKYVLDQENKYFEVCDMKFNTDAELIDISFSKIYDVWYSDSKKQMEIYEEWKAIKKSMDNKNDFSTEQFHYGDILEFSMKPLYKQEEFIYLGQGVKNQCCAFVWGDSEAIFYETIDELCPTGIGPASLWLNIKNAESSDSDLREISEFLKLHPETEDEIWDLADEDVPGTYILIQDIIDFIRNYDEEKKNGEEYEY